MSPVLLGDQTFPVDVENVQVLYNRISGNARPGIHIHSPNEVRDRNFVVRGNILTNNLLANPNTELSSQVRVYDHIGVDLGENHIVRGGAHRRASFDGTDTRCTIPAGGAVCTAQIQWQLTGSAVPARGAVVRVNGRLFSSGATGSASAPWIREGAYRFALFENVDAEFPIAIASVRGIAE